MKFDVDLEKQIIKIQECKTTLKELKILLHSFDMPNLDDFFIVVEPIVVKEYLPSPNPIIIEKYKDNTNPYPCPLPSFPNYPIITYTSNG